MPYRFVKSALLLAFCFLAADGLAQTVFFNEFHYDNSGTDVNEFIEITGPAGTDMSDYTLVLYNGSNGQSYDVVSLTGTLTDDCDGNGFLVENFPSNGIQNGNPDGFCLYDNSTSTVVQFLSYEGSFTAGDDLCNGATSTDIGQSETASTLATESIQLSGTGTDYTDFTWEDEAVSSPGDCNTSGGGQSFVPLSSPDIALSIDGTAFTCGSTYDFDCVINGNSEQVTVSISNEGSVDLTSISGSFLAGGDTEFTLSSGIGSTTVTPGNSTTFAIDYSPASNGIHNRTFEISSDDPDENPCTFSFSGSSDATCADPCPRLESFTVNACGANEGLDEVVFFSTGSSSYDWVSENLTIDYPNSGYGTFCMSGCGANNFVNTSSNGYIATLNANLTCDAFFASAPTPIPANSQVMVFTSDEPTYNHGFSGLCGMGPIYVLFTNSTGSTGKFANQVGANRTLQVDFSSGCSTTATYFSSSANTGDDGATVQFVGPTATDVAYMSDGCTPATPFLPVEFQEFSATPTGNIVQLDWTTVKEVNNQGFEIERKHGNNRFEQIGTVAGAGNTQEAVKYRYVDDQAPANQTLYYRLKQIDYDGASHYSKTLAVNINASSESSLTVYPSIVNHRIDIDFSSQQPQSIQIMDATGRVIHTQQATDSHTTIDCSAFASGVYFVRVGNESARFIKQ